MEDVIRRSGNTFGTNEAFILAQLSVAAVPTAAIIFLEFITDTMPTICIVNPDTEECEPYYGKASEVVCDEDSDVVWEYVDEYSSIISKFDIICRPYWWLEMPMLVNFLGMLLGCFLAGYLAHLIGRKPSLMIFLFAEGVFLGILIYVSSYPVWLLLRFLTGLSLGYFVVTKLLIIEGLKIKYRHAFTACIWCCFACGFYLLSILAYFFDHYTDRLAVLVLIITLLWFLYLFGIEESLRWLLVMRKEKEAKYLLGKISYQNSVDLPSYEDIPKPDDDQYHLLELFKMVQTRYLLGILLCITILSFYLVVEYTVVDINSASFFNLSLSVNLAIIGTCHLLGVLVAAAACYGWGRRPTVSSINILIFITLIFSIAMATAPEWVVMGEGLCVRTLASGLLYFSSLYSLEVFATPIRAKAVGFITSTMAVGGLLAGLLQILKYRTGVALVFLVLSLIAVLLATIASFALRETKGQPLPERIESMPQILPYREWCQCTADNPENHPLLNSPLFSQYHANQLTTTCAGTEPQSDLDTDERTVEEGSSELASPPQRNNRQGRRRRSI